MLNKTTMMRAVLVAALVVIAFQTGNAQPSGKGKTPIWDGPKVTQIDIDGLKKLLKPNGKPVLINFWATWCDPCREEFPDLVKLDAAYKGKIDFYTVSLDDLADIKTYVPKFLGEQKAEMPAFLLKTPDDNAAIALVSPEWTGNLPLTILLKPDGTTAYLRKGIVKYATITAEIDKLVIPDAKAATVQ
jgi:thiol-disulfide isomerase/thioredoxin